MTRQLRRVTYGVILLLLWPSGARTAGAQSADDAFADPATRRLIERGRAARGELHDELRSYEGIIRERLYAGLDVDGFRRERGLFRSEQVARIRWERDGPETIEWLGRRRDVPIAGDVAEVSTEDDDLLPSFPLDPAGYPKWLEDSDFLDPLDPEAPGQYRYRAGDTLRIELTALGRTLVLAEVRFEPRQPDFELLSGSVWFDTASAALVRSVVRPSREFNLEIDEPGDAEEVPGFLKPIVFSVEMIVIEYGLRDLRWWIPQRIRFEGTGRVASLARVPIVLESEAIDIDLDGQELDPNRPAPDGWQRYSVDEEGRREVPVGPDAAHVVYAPSDSALRESPWLRGDAFTTGSDAFSSDELASIRSELRRVARPEASPSEAAWALGGYRYNRIEALSARVVGTTPLGGRWTGRASLRVGLADRVPGVVATAERSGARGDLRFRLYDELRSVTHLETPLGVPASARALLLGYDDGQYLRAGGADVRLRRRLATGALELRVFGERHRRAEKNTDVSLANLVGAAVQPPNIEADAIDVLGLAGAWRLQSGVDPDGPILLGVLRAEAGAVAGRRPYTRYAVGGTVSYPVAGRWSAALDLEAGSSTGTVPVQMQWFLGGASTLRGFPGGSLAGEAFGRGRLEVAYGFPAVRLVAFSDFGWAGLRSSLFEGSPAISAGIGASVMDGIVRMDVAQVLQGRDPARLRVYVLLDGLL